MINCLHFKEIEGPLLFSMPKHHDSRGFFVETYNPKINEFGVLEKDWVQDNQSFSKKNVLRGLHFQCPTWQAKLVRVISGKILDIIVDIRKGSPTFGKSISLELTSDAEDFLNIFYVPAGFAHGFLVLSETADVAYKVSAPFVANESYTLNWNSAGLDFVWPIDNPILSEKDLNGIDLSKVSTLV